MCVWGWGGGFVEWVKSAPFVPTMCHATSNTNALETGNEIESGPFGPEQIGTGHGIVFGCWNDFHNFHVVQRCGCGLWLHQQWQQCHYEKCNLEKRKREGYLVN